MSTSPPEDFTWKPALLVSPHRARLDDTGLTAWDGSGRMMWRLGWDRVDRATLVELSAQGSRMRRFDLTDRGGEVHTLSCTSPLGDPSQDADSAAHLRLIASALDRLDAAQPGFAVKIGEHGRARAAIFGIGVLAILFAAGLLIATLSGIGPSGRTGAVLPPVLLLAGIGAVLVRSYRPWVKRPALDAAALAKALRRQAEGRSSHG